MNKVQREVKEILKHSVLWTLYFVAIFAVALVAIYTQVTSRCEFQRELTGV
ncbi:hypothetical protein WFH67_16270 [Vibrio vulnificus]|uniref:hypothetical protein n=1 Tax=Vibrio vulnificus TaxID=672 RepID=UPI001CDBF2AB|nr:hypothetical protein [Vibrio vulnificus]MCA3907066.1 hypothetical protein [Vibrio vulnificus]